MGDPPCTMCKLQMQNYGKNFLKNHCKKFTTIENVNQPNSLQLYVGKNL